MQIYQEYDEIKKKYDDAKKKVSDLLEIKASQFYGTQPGAVQGKEIICNSNATSDKYLNYCGRIENIDIDIENVKKLLELRTEQLQSKEQELKESYDKLDKVYYYKYIEKSKVSCIARKIGYSREQTYRFIKDIEETLNLILI